MADFRRSEVEILVFSSKWAEAGRTKPYPARSGLGVSRAGWQEVALAKVAAAMVDFRRRGAEIFADPSK